MSFPWRTLLVASLSINLLIVGAGIGFVAGGARLRGPTLNQLQLQRQPLLRALPQADRAMLMDELQRAWAAGKPTRQAAAETRRAVLAAAQKEPYDEAAVRKALSALRDADMAVLAGYHDALATALGKIPASERAEALRAAGRPAQLGAQLGQGGRPGPLREQMRDRLAPPPPPPQ